MNSRLVIFDVDGTLTKTNKVDGQCYLQALADEFGIAGINTNWTEYEHATDSGVFPEIIREHLGRSPSAEDCRRFQLRFVSLLGESFLADPARFSPIPGASAMLAWLAQTSRWRAAIATGAFHPSAALKLQKAGIDPTKFPLASADDAVSREDILRKAVARASEAYEQERFERIVSVGDAPWDVKTARNLGLPFVGITGDQRDPDQLRRLGARHVLPDFTDLAAFHQALETAEVPSWPDVPGAGREGAKSFQTTIWGNSLTFQTRPDVFSPRWADRGTLAMLNRVELTPADRVLDLGCGYGLVGIAAAKVIGQDRVTMVDNDPHAVELAKANACANGVPGIRIECGDGLAAVPDAEFSLILCNPPFHEGFSTPKRFIDEGFRRLTVGGKMVMVVKRLTWYRNRLAAVFGGVRVMEDEGYYVLMADKRSDRPAPRKKSDPTRKHLKRVAQSRKRRD